jgi:DNA-binding MarR family transcriptional regulator
MSSGSVPSRVIEYISKRNSLSLDDLVDDLKVSKITSKNYLSRLESMNMVKRVGRGLYQVGGGKTAEVELNPRVQKLAETLRNRYQFADLAIWSLSMLSDYSHYAIGKDLMFVETDETTSESVKDYLRENGYNPILKPEKKDYREYTSMPGELVFILERGERYEVKGQTPSPEKVWLDVYYLVTRKGLSFSPGELGVIFANMLRGEGVNFNRLRRYAHRRGVGNEVIVFLCGLRRSLPNRIPEGALGEADGTLKFIEEMVEAASE